ncbi:MULTISPECIES: tRNA pseudouridine(38-40) synthase TruA [unclassified Bacillus (in: firmicutes)]|uniref:tRNA pseudouridine(38-40) synthase TruA n=1 Tax=Bacillus TaxID=1386 RepID=UPI00338FDA36
MKVKCIVSYDGTNFKGYQVQPGQRTVQTELESALARMHKQTEPISVVASGRTDSGVHAKGQVIHFHTPLIIPMERWPFALNSLLPDDIRILKAEEVDESFHARFSVASKEYRYVVSTETHQNVFMRHYACHYPYRLDVDRMKEAATYLIGTYDFTSFCAANTEVQDKVRTIYTLEWKNASDGLEMRVRGNGFLYNMVRIIAGTLLEVGAGKFRPEDVKAMLAARNRKAAGKTAPSHGLYLWEVFYDN